MNSPESGSCGAPQEVADSFTPSPAPEERSPAVPGTREHGDPGAVPYDREVATDPAPDQLPPDYYEDER